MGLNIQAYRRVSLKGFALGWDNCYVKVRAVNEAQRTRYQQELGDTKDETVATAVTKQACKDVIVGGVILNTTEDGHEESYEFSRDDVDEVVEALSFPWQTEILSIATGADRLKAMTSSI